MNGHPTVGRLAGAVLVGVAAASLGAAPASAHPSDEILQQAYLGQSADQLDVELDLTPGVLVSGAFAAGVDTDDDQQLSPAEIAVHSRRVTAKLSLHVDGRSVPLTITHRGYPTRDLLASSAGILTITATATLPPGARQVVLRDDYDPGLKNSVQMAALVASGQTGPPTEITHGAGGRAITLTLGATTTTPGGEAASPPTGSPPTSRESSWTSSSMARALSRTVTSHWAPLSLVGVAGLLAALLGAFRAPSRPREGPPRSG